MEYRCSRVAGAVHSSGNVVFSPTSSVVYSAIGNRVGFVDLARTSANALGNFETRRDVDRLAMTSDGVLLVAIDVEGRLSAVNVPRRTVLHRLNLRARCRDAAFSADDGTLAVTHKRLVQLWLAPARRRRELAAFSKLATFGGASGETTCLRWSADSTLLAVGSEDATVRVYSVSHEEEEEEGDVPTTEKKKKVRAFKLAAHKASIVFAFWAGGGTRLTTVARDCVAAAWALRDVSEHDEAMRAATDREQVFKLEKKHFLWSDANDGGRGANATVSAADATGRLLAAAFSSGVFAIYEHSADDPSYLECVHRLSVARGGLDAIALDASRGGELVALASRRFGQLAVWEWRAESFVLKQQGHDHEATCAAWSPDGRVFASGATDSRVKLWSDQSGFCFATFEDHTAPVTALAFAGNVVYSASRDGTVRAYDLARYRNFRTYPAPAAATSAASLVSLAVDADGEIVCAGSDDPFEIYVWSARTGKLLDALAGHEGPVSCLGCNPRDGSLASGSWDATVRLWNVYRGEHVDKLEHPAQVLALAYRRDGKRLCASSRDGTIRVWDPAEAALLCVLDCRRDLLSGGHLAATAYVESLSYSVDGRCVLAAGRSRCVCVYAVRQKVLLAKLRVSARRDATSLDEDDDDPRERHEADDDEDDDLALPGAKRAKVSGSRLARATARVNAVAFSPSGRSFVAVAPGAILVYSLDDDATFAPFDVDEAVTPKAVLDALHRKDPGKALVMALQLADDTLVSTVLANTLPADLHLAIRALPPLRAPALLRLLAARLDDDKDLEF